MGWHFIHVGSGKVCVTEDDDEVTFAINELVPTGRKNSFTAKDHEATISREEARELAIALLHYCDNTGYWSDVYSAMVPYEDER